MAFVDIHNVGPEEWRVIEGYPDYQISNFGKIKSFKKDKNGYDLKYMSTNFGHCLVDLFNVNHKGKKFLVHQLVLKAFVGPKPEGMVCNHKDGNKKNNCIDNLEYCTQQYNNQHALDTGLRKMPSGNSHWNGKRKFCKNGHEFSDDNTYEWDGHRICRRCQADRMYLRRNKKSKRHKYN